MKNYYFLVAFVCLVLLSSPLSGQNLVLSTQAFPASCNGVCNGGIDLSVSGGTPGLTYTWSNSVTTQDLSGLCPGTYTVTVTGSNGIAQTTSATVTHDAGMTLNVCVSNVTCFDGNDGKADLTVSGGTAPYSYVWSNGATTQDMTNLVAGNYTPTVTDANGCTATGFANIIQPQAFNISSTVIYASNGNNNGSIDLTVTGGTAPYTYNWSSGEITADLTDLQPGLYEVIVTDALGCIRGISIAVQEVGGGTLDPLLLNGVTTSSGCGATCTGKINLTVSNGVPGYNMVWTGPTGVTWNEITFGTYNSPELCPGTYCVTITDNQQLTASACYTIGQASAQDVEIQSTNAAFCNYNDGTSPSTCEKVCPQTTVTYFAEPSAVCFAPPTTQAGTWTVSGAESFAINPNGKEVVVKWGNTGAGLVTFSSSNPDLCFQSSHCVTIVEEPVAKFKTDPPVAANATLQLCKGQTVFFKNESLNAELFEWQFNDNFTTVADENTQHTFLLPGNFTVTLIARSNCLCADTTIMLVEVLDSEPPLLDCVGSVCSGETVTYTTSSSCSSYTWAVSANGTIVSGGTAGDNTITVQWGQGPTGTISLSASGCGNAACPQASIFSIPIISNNAEIRGDAFVCPENEEEYSIDLFDGTQYNWTLPTGGTIIQGQGTNKITVAWSDQASTAVSHYLSVEYSNCYLGCGGEDSLPVKILTPFFIKGVVEICEKLPTFFQAKLTPSLTNINCNWIIYREDGSLFWNSVFPNNSINFPTNAPPGKYRIVTIPQFANETCSPEAELIVTVVARPPKPAAIDGQSVICSNTPLTYTVLGTEPYSVLWSVFNGLPGTQTGSPVNVTWNNNATHWLTATYVSTDGLGCKSDTTKLNVSTVSVLSISGAPAACEGAVSYYSADFYQNFDYQWQIIPATAGAIKSGQGTNGVEIFWQTLGNHKLRVTTCGMTTDFNVTVWSNPEPVVSHPAGLCLGDLGVVTTTVPFSVYAWQTADGDPVSSLATPGIPGGAYALEVTDVHGCKGASDFNIDVYPIPNVSLTTADPTGFCNNSSFVSLTALVSENEVFTYEWRRDLTSLGAGSSVYVTNQYGLFTVIATNGNGCKATAPPILIYEYCGGGGGGYCTSPPGNGAPLCPPGSVQAVPDPTPTCDSIRLVLNDYTGQYVPGSARWWTGISGGVQVGTALGDDASFIYPNAGKYIVIVAVTLLNGSVCEAIDSIDIEAVAQFSQQLACPGDSTMFLDKSTRLPEASITSWAWDFGEAGNSDVSSQPSPGHPFVSAGNYVATLTITTATGCTATYSDSVFVPELPSLAFAPPVANCTGNATAFVLTNAAGLVGSAWDFGDPASGALNESGGNPVYHNYAPAGNYTVTISATNTYGCTASLVQPVNIVANPFSGTITPASPVMCEGKTITLIAPVGSGASYVWTDGTNLPTLTVDHEGVYGVTLTNGNGCTYSPPDKNVEVNPAPVGTIKALDINELGQVIGVTYPTLSVCEGEDVNLQIQDNGFYTYQWSGGNGTDEVLIFSEDRDNLLDVGTHTYSVTLTNGTTGCTAVLAPFEVNVNPVPSGFSLATNNVCAGLASTISYTGPQPPEWQILWNNGETGPAITTEDEGLYFVRVVNEFGCVAQSNTVVIFPGPNVSALPGGCHERCNPDTICLPVMPEIVAWQWYFEGNPIPGATTSQFAATESGTYYAELLDNNGCLGQSADLVLELYDGYGNILGQVWSDVNDNGIIDGADTLVSLIPVQLWQNGALVNGNVSGTAGDFEWLNVFSTGYTVQLDTQLLSPLWEVVILSDSVRLTGCGGKVFADLLVDAFTCPPIFTQVSLSACPGTSATYNGTPILAGQTQDFTLEGFLGCDSVVTVTVTALPTSASSLNVSVCPGATFSYQGALLSAGQTQAFTLINAAGCDSIVTVTVGALPTSASTLNAQTCPGSAFTYQGVNLAVGQTQAFTLTNSSGCDSIVTVSVSALPTSASTLNAQTCPGSTFTYQGVQLAVGQTQAFTLTNSSGCDSIVTVTVGALPTSASTLNAGACPGSTYTYQGVNLAVGQTQAFTLTNAAGCDSVVTVTVSALPVSTGTATFGVCPNETYLYQGQALAAGTVQAFRWDNWLGCDSIVTVTVVEKTTSFETREVRVCPGASYVFNGETVEIGEVKDIHFTNGEGCDSLITISVVASPELEFTVGVEKSCPTTGTGSLSVQVLPGGSLPSEYALNGGVFQSDPRFVALAAGDYMLRVKDENGCLFDNPVTIEARPNLEVVLPVAFVIPCTDESVTLVPQLGGDTSGLQLSWWNGATTPTVTTAEASPVWLDATNQCGEALHKTSEVAWADSDGEPIHIFVPNIFSPEAKNAENTMFRAFFGDNLTLLDYHLQVYDRWGSLMFESEQPEIGWTGSFRDKIMEPGVFAWQLEVKVAFCGRELTLYRKGDVTVER